MKVFLAIAVVLLLFCSVGIWRWLAYEESYSGDLSVVEAPLVIFDFDGTLCPSYDLFIEKLNTLSDEYGFKEISDEEKKAFRELSATKAIGKLGIKMYQLPFLVKKIRAAVKEELFLLQPVPGIVDMIRKLKADGVSLGILTSNSKENVAAYLQRYDINVFDFIYSGNNLFGKDGHLNKILKESHLQDNKSSVFFVGDELRDMKAALKVGIKGVAVPWGFNSKTILKSIKPHYLIETPKELEEIVKIENKKKRVGLGGI